MTAKGHLMGAAVRVQAKETEELRCLATRMGGEKAAPALPVANRTASVALGINAMLTPTRAAPRNLANAPANADRGVAHGRCEPR